MTRKSVGIYIWPGMTMVDSLIPHQVLGLMPQLEVYSFSKTKEPLESDTGMGLVPKYGFADCPQPDILVVGGGGDVLPQLQDREVIEHLAKVGTSAQYIGSVCTGSLLMAEAGLLDGCKATTHWAYMDILAAYEKVEVVDARVVSDGNRLTGGGVTAGLDWAFTLIGQIVSPEAAMAAELILEYRPEPPYGTGAPAAAPEGVKAFVDQMLTAYHAPTMEFVTNR